MKRTNYPIFFIQLAILIACSQVNVKTIALDQPIKDRAAHPKLLKMLNERQQIDQPQNPFLTPVIKVDEADFSKTSAVRLSVKGAVYQEKDIAFTIAITDNNSNGLFDETDDVDFSGYGEDSVFLTHSALKIRGKSPVYIRFGRQVLEIAIDSALEEIKVSDKGDFSYHDLVFPMDLPDIMVTDIQNDQQMRLTDLKNKNGQTLIIRTAAGCKPCFQTFQKYLARYDRLTEEAKQTTKIFFFPEGTDISNIVKYTRELSLDHHFYFVKGDIDAYSSRYSLLGLPDGVLYDTEGKFFKNHFLLSNFK